MTVGSISNHNVATIDSSEGIVDAAVRMREEHVGDLIVVDSVAALTPKAEIDKTTKN